jgi:NADH:ubiquinone oxidoreductase subunit 2 (subunit N)
MMSIIQEIISHFHPLGGIGFALIFYKNDIFFNLFRGKNKLMYSVIKSILLPASVLVVLISAIGYYFYEKHNPINYSCNEHQESFDSGYKTINGQNYYIVFCGVFSYPGYILEKFRILVFTDDKKSCWLNAILL